jgi:hypothetical protein
MMNSLVLTVAKLLGKGALVSPAVHSLIQASEPNQAGVMGLLCGLVWSNRRRRLAAAARRKADDAATPPAS